MRPFHPGRDEGPAAGKKRINRKFYFEVTTTMIDASVKQDLREMAKRLQELRGSL
ncbi:hypothetical protein [Paenibacillus tarimensis]|uniref:hypothetical protein n=1 Tax=Paenibacillus tarimensis TaxID=416012 RepID=UPI001F46D237|nr:hypothetical protein [Paenibacillus tarimensis]MCF2944103.1 hypothetical protein [Paenibacillus tarimensis]